ncbi:MAG TPA: CHAD domain-containing protein [Candidatus Dormibacteraeota bacterium]|nr:CHAD domain-containing protein [Candidatus Dormibacteraeota bacterium]
MNRVVDRAAKVPRSFDIDEIHDLRVAIRRCRTMADALSEVNPSPGWRKLKKATGAMFHTLGELRDVQVMVTWLKKLGPASDPVRRQLLRLLARRENHCRDAAVEALDAFDRKDWKKLTRKLDSKAGFFPLESVVFQRLALARLNQAAELYQQARRKRSIAAWHRLRIAIKRFRYVVDNFLPARYEAWADDLKRVQDLLGEAHDLDVLRAAVRREAASLDSSAVDAFVRKIDAARKSRLTELNSKLSGAQSLWLVWRAGLPLGHSLTVAPVPQRRFA